MKARSVTLVIIVAVLCMVGLGGCSAYNRMVTLDEGVRESWAQVETVLQRRMDLIPNLVETVKGFAAQEREVFIKVTEARSRVAGAANIPEKIQANNELASALSRLLVVVERYPDLKSNENFIRLQDELAGTENRIAVARRRYNEAVKAYNVAIRRFPTNLLAQAFRFEKASFFEAPEAATEPPKVSF